MNAESFSDLELEEQKELLDYIKNSFVQVESINESHSAYGLKQHFTSTHVLPHHVTSKCFMEAMVAAGFTAQPIKGVSEPNWRFNIGKPLYER